MKEKKFLYDWCVENNRQDLIKSLLKAGVDIETIKTTRYASKKVLPFFCEKCKEKYDELIKTNPNLPKFYIQKYEVQKKTISEYGCKVCNSRYLVKGVNDLKTFCLKEENKSKYGHLINEWSDFNKQKIDEVFPNHTKKVYWECPKCGYGKNKEWHVEPNSRIKGNNCPNCSSELRKSHAEKAVYYYIKKIFPNAIENYKIPNTDQLELDIYIEELSLGIEYDGSYWHNKKPKKDQNKYKICKDRNIKLLRLREKGSKETPNIATNCYYLKSHNNKDLNNAIQYAFEYIKSISDNDFVIPQIDWEKDFAEIEELIELQVKENSVAKYQLLDEQWHPDLNGKTTTDRVYVQSNTKRYWRCLECGYGTKGEWYVSPNSRVEDAENNKINGCPSCANKKLYKGYNDFETRCNDEKYQKEYKKKYNEDLKLLLKEWNEEENSKIIAKNDKPLTKDNITFGSGDEVYWICSNPKCRYGKNGEWKTPLKSRTISGRGCPACAGKIVEKGKNDIATTHPEIADQWDEEMNLKEFGITKYEVSKGSHLFAYWKCDNGHSSYQVVVNDKTANNSCPLCRNWKTDLETYCNNEENQKKYKDKFDRELKSILEDWHPDNKIKPKDIRHTDDNEQILWKCPICKRPYISTVRKKLKSETGACNECATKQRKLSQRANLPKEKTLAYANPEFVKDWHPDRQKNYIKELDLYLTPENIALGNHTDKIWWKCHICEYEWQMDVRYRNQHQQKCPKCNYEGKKH